MHKVEQFAPVPRRRGVVFFVQTVTGPDSYGQRGVPMRLGRIRTSPALYATEIGGIKFEFIAYFPAGRPSKSRVRYFPRVDYSSLDEISDEKVYFVNVNMYAVITRNASRVQHIFETSIDAGKETSELRSISEQVVSNGFDAAQEFIDLARTRYEQYALQNRIDSRAWSYLIYFSAPRQEFYSIVLPDNFRPRSLAKRQDPDYSIPGAIILRVVNSAMSRRELAYVRKATFSDDMVAEALVELAAGRVRAAVLHAVIALESSSKRLLEGILERRFPTLISADLADAVAKEASLALLSRLVVESTADLQAGGNPDWSAISALCQLRNTIVHQRRRKLPKPVDIKSQILQVKAYVDLVEGFLANSS